MYCIDRDPSPLVENRDLTYPPVHGDAADVHRSRVAKLQSEVGGKGTTRSPMAACRPDRGGRRNVEVDEEAPLLRASSSASPFILLAAVLHRMSYMLLRKPCEHMRRLLVRRGMPRHIDFLALASA